MRDIHISTKPSSVSQGKPAEPSHRAPKPSPDRRAQLRLPVDHELHFVLLTGNNIMTTALTGTARDISTAGVRIIGCSELAAGQRGVLELHRTSGERALVGFEVRHVTPSTGSRPASAGLSFTKLPRELVRRAFLRSDGTLARLREIA